VAEASGSGRRRRNRSTPPRARVATTVIGALALVLLAAGCQLVQLPTGGFLMTPDAPSGRRLLIVGDSLIRTTSLATAGPLLPAGVETLIEAVNGSGLVSGPVHWDTRATELVDQFHPTVVLMSIGGNFSAPYWPPYAPPGAPGSPEEQAWITANWGSPEWLDRSATQAVAASKAFAARGAHVYWLAPPPMPPQWGDPSVRDKLWDRLSATLPTSVPGTKLLSVVSSVSDANGKWVPTKVICGTELEIRSVEWDGGLHFTSDGAGTYGRATARALSAAESWPAPPQKCPGLTD